MHSFDVLLPFHDLLKAKLVPCVTRRLKKDFVSLSPTFASWMRLKAVKTIYPSKDIDFRNPVHHTYRFVVLLVMNFHFLLDFLKALRFSNWKWNCKKNVMFDKGRWIFRVGEETAINQKIESLCRDSVGNVTYHFQRRPRPAREQRLERARHSPKRHLYNILCTKFYRP